MDLVVSEKKETSMQHEATTLSSNYKFMVPEFLLSNQPKCRCLTKFVSDF